MKFILTANVYESSHFYPFVKSMHQAHPDATILIAGDLLNSSPPPAGNLLEHSILIELFGSKAADELRRLHQEKWKGVDRSFLVDVYRDMILPSGASYYSARQIAEERYQKIFFRLEESLGHANCYFIPGDLDYPDIARTLTKTSPRLHFLDSDVLTQNGIKIGALGGIINTIHPFREFVELAPNEMTEAEYARRLKHLWGVNVLITHVAPEEFPPLQQFITESPVQLVICRNPCQFSNPDRIQQAMPPTQLGGKTVLYASTFTTPHYETLAIDLHQDELSHPQIEIIHWNASSLNF